MIRAAAAAAAAALGLLASTVQAADPESPETHESVQFEAPDGMELYADLYRGDPDAATVVLLHEHRKQRSDWAPLIPDLVAAGFNILNLDLRGHGESIHKGDAVLSAVDLPMAMTGTLVRQSIPDMETALGYLQGRGIQVERVVLIGAAYGNVLAVMATVRRPDIRGIVLLSPIERGYGISTKRTIHEYRGDLLTIVARDDRIAAGATHVLIAAHPGAEEEIFFDSGGHGTALLDSKPEIRPRIVEFVKAHTEK
ncbi:MAG: alpha/beta hydrolase [Myxococcota bacterium]